MSRDSLWEGAHLVWLDGLQVEGGAEIAAAKLLETAQKQLMALTSYSECADNLVISETEDKLHAGPFTIAKNSRKTQQQKQTKYSFQSETIGGNIRKIIRYFNMLFHKTSL